MAEYNVGNNTSNTLNGMFKEVYADKIKNLIPDGVKLYNMIDFVKDSQKNGSEYHQPVVLGLEHGITYGGSTGTAFALNSAIAGTMQDAKVQGYEMVLRSALSVAAASRSASSQQAFEKVTKHLVANMLRSITRRLEIAMFYGQSGIAAVSGSPAANVVTIHPDSWAPGIWGGAENMLVEVFSSDGVTKRTGTNTDGSYSVSSVSFADKTITVDDDQNIADTDIIFFKGAAVAGPTYNEAVGLYKICSNAGTLFNISAASYAIWAGNNVSDAQDISFSALEAAISKAIAKGLADEDVCAFVNIDHWNVLLDDIVAKRQFDSSYSKDKAVEGHKYIEFYGQNGMVKIVPSIYVKGSHCFIVPLDEFSRIGSQDITFEQPGFEGKFFRLLEGINGYELRAYTDQALFCAAPGKCIVLSDLNVPA